MKQIALSLLLCSMLSHLFAQKAKTVSTYLSFSYSKTVYDKTLGNNPGAVGLGLQSNLNMRSIIRPSLELTGDIYLEDDKVLRTNEGKPIEDVGGVVVSVFTGLSVNPSENFYCSFLLGPTFINGRTLLAIKPSIGFNFSKNQRFTGKVSFVNIFNREPMSKDDMGSVNIAFGVKLF
jgi:hypothetical protein